MNGSLDYLSDSGESLELSCQSIHDFLEEKDDLPNSTTSLLNGQLVDGQVNLQTDQPYLKIIEQPQSRGFRFRYKCEGPSHGGLQGERTEKNRKTFPTVMIANYSGPAKVLVSLVTDGFVPRTHAHELVGKHCKKGICYLSLKAGQCSKIMFPNLGIMHVTKRKVVEVLQERIMESMNLDKQIRCGETETDCLSLTEEEIVKAKMQAGQEAKNMPLNVVKLCFQAYLADEDGKYSRLLPSVISKPIYDSKSPGAAALKICRMDKYGGCCTGKEEVFLLCEKVQKDDIAVRFIEHNDDGTINWEDFGNFGPLDVHRQFAIVFKTPPYRDVSIEKPVTVHIMLQRKSDGETSEPKAFTYYPQNLDKDDIAKKRRKILPGIGGNSYPRSSGDGSSGGLGSVGSSNANWKQDQSNDDFSSYAFNADLPMTFENMESELSEKSLWHLCKAGKLVCVLSEAEEYTEQQRGCWRRSARRHLVFYCVLIVIAQVGPSGDVMSTTIAASSLALNDLEVDSKPAHITCAEINHVLEVARERNSMSAKQPTKLDGTSLEVAESSTPGEKLKALKEAAVQTDRHEMLSKKAAIQQIQANIRRIAKRMMLALRDYAIGGSIQSLLMVQRQLVMVPDEDGDNSLFLAIINRQLKAASELLGVVSTLTNCNNKINSYNLLYQTALHLAVLTRQPAVIDMLLHAGSDPAVVDRNGNTPAHLAILEGYDDCLEVLVRYLRPGMTEKKPFPELDILNYNGFSAVHLACQTGNLNAMKTLVYAKVNINKRDGKSGRTPLHQAVEAGELSIAGYLLLEAAAEINATTFDGNTPLHFACGRNLAGMVALLLAAGADPEVENDECCMELDDDEDDDDDGDGEINLALNMRGTKPRDLVQGNVKILRILNGEPYSSLMDGALEKDSETMGDRSSPQHSICVESGEGMENFDVEHGDLDKLDNATRIELANLLDSEQTGANWKTLASKLSIDYLISTIITSSCSPTKYLLNTYEALDGTILKLRNALLELQLENAVSILDKALSHMSLNVVPTEEVSATSAAGVNAGSSTEKSNIDNWLDSGVVLSGRSGRFTSP